MFGCSGHGRSTIIILELHSIECTSDIYFTCKAHLRKDELSYDAEAVKLVQLILKHLICQLELVYILVQRKEIIIATTNALFH